jgi:cyclic pyranopterin phosphate synthase
VTRKARKAGAQAGLTHFDEAGAARMVEVGAKPETAREAVASGVVVMAPATARAIAAGGIGKGDVLGTARLAGIQAAKRTAELIPLCHPLRLTGLDVELRVGRDRVTITARVRAFDRTGVEMEALTAVSVAALTVYDMCKAIDRGMVIAEVGLDEKRGGKSGAWTRRRADASRRGRSRTSP